MALVCVGAVAAEPARITISDEIGAFVEQGTGITFVGSAEASQVQNTWLMVDRRSVTSKPGGGKYSLAWDTRGVSLGRHFVEIVAVGLNAKKIASRAEVELTQAAPIRLMVPPGDLSISVPVKISLRCTSGFSPVRAALSIDGHPSKQSLTIKDSAIDWDASAVETGEHSLSATAWDANGFVAYSAPVTVKAPLRLSIQAPKTAVVSQDNPDIILNVAVPDGVAVKKLTASIAGKVAAQSDSACASLKIPALDMESGICEVSAELTDTNGLVSKWGPERITVDNQYLATQAAKAAADKAADEAAKKAKQDQMAKDIAIIDAEDAKTEAREQAKIKEKKLNDWFFSGGYYDATKEEAIKKAAARANLANSGGTVGSVRGMCVMTVGDVLEFGATSTISAKVTVGDGTVSMNATDIDEDFADAITCARKYVIRYIANLGYKVDWSKTNIDLHFDMSGPMSGDSAGAAIATAILSSALKIPIRNEVVMTGAVEPDGTVRPVGAVDMKAAAAFSDPTVLTIIVPRFKYNVADVLSLPPKLLAGHRLVAAGNLSEVFRQALVGYDKGTLSAASSLFNEGLTLYTNGQTDEAIRKLEEAQKYTPEDLTIPIWIQAMNGSIAKKH